MFVYNLKALISTLRSRNYPDEWYLADFIENNIATLSAEDAFKGASVVLDMFSTEKHAIYELLMILQALHRQSDTTQIPTFLVSNPNTFDNLYSRNNESDLHDLIKDIKQLYQR